MGPVKNYSIQEIEPKDLPPVNDIQVGQGIYGNLNSEPSTPVKAEPSEVSVAEDSLSVDDSSIGRGVFDGLNSRPSTPVVTPIKVRPQEHETKGSPSVDDIHIDQGIYGDLNSRPSTPVMGPVKNYSIQEIEPKDLPPVNDIQVGQGIYGDLNSEPPTPVKAEPSEVSDSEDSVVVENTTIVRGLFDNLNTPDPTPPSSPTISRISVDDSNIGRGIYGGLNSRPSTPGSSPMLSRSQSKTPKVFGADVSSPSSSRASSPMRDSNQRGSSSPKADKATRRQAVAPKIRGKLNFGEKKENLISSGPNVDPTK
jgi:hypothetical protein